MLNDRSSPPHGRGAAISVEAAAGRRWARSGTPLIAGLAAAPRWLTLLVAALLVRCATFGNPIVHYDEQFYFVTAQRMLQGALPFVDIFDRKPVGLFLLYAPAAALGVPWGIIAYQLMALASAVLTAVLIARIADRAGWARGALPAALLYLFMLNVADGQGGQAPVFYNLPMVAAIALLVPRAADAVSDRRRVGRALAAMLLVGLAMQIKYSAVFEGLFLGLWLLAREWRLGTAPATLLMRGAGYAAAALLPTVAAGLVYAAAGQFDAWFFANFASVLNRGSDPPAELIESFLKLVLFLAPLLVISLLSLRLPCEGALARQQRTLLFGWLASAVIGLILFGSWFNHYALPVMVPASLCCAGFFALSPIGRRVVAPLLLILALVGGEIALVTAAWHRGSPAQFQTIVDAIGRGPGCLYVYSGDSMFYGYSGRCALSSRLFPSHLSRERENGAVGVDQIEEVDRIFNGHPAVVVMRRAFSGERIAVRERVMRLMQRGGYRLRGRYPLGDDLISVYAAPADASVAVRRRSSSDS